MEGAVCRRGVRLALRDWTERDLPTLESWLQPGHAWQDLDGPYFGPPSNEERERVLDRYRDAVGSGRLAVPRRELAIARIEDDLLVGRVNRYWQSRETHWLSLGITIFDPDHWGRALGFEALGLWCEYVLDNLPDVIRLDLRTWSGNERMIRLAARLGYVEEARFRKARVVDGEYYDSVGYGILREEWRARSPDGFAACLAAMLD